MSQKDRLYVAIDLKSFYASVECVERNLNPMTTNLVVADVSRTEKTICLAVSSALKKYGIPGRARLFEVIERVKDVNAVRRQKAPRHAFSGESYDASALSHDPALAVSYIIAPPQMAKYMAYSARIHEIYLKYVAPEDIHVYSIDEVFMDVTDYLDTYRMTARELAATIIQDVLQTIGITATAGIGTNLYLSKVAMDIVAKHIQPDSQGVRIAQLNEMTYRRLLWDHRPLTDFWRVGRGYANRLEKCRLFTMGDIARCSISNEALLYKMFGKNAAFLIDHAWGYEPCTMAAIKAYQPQVRCLSSGQVLHCPYDYEKTRLIVREMAEQMALDLLSKRLLTNQIVLTIGYDRTNLTNPGIDKSGIREVVTDAFGRKHPKHAHGTQNLGRHSSSGKCIVAAAMELYERIINKKLLARRVTIVANNLIREKERMEKGQCQQLSLFDTQGTPQSDADQAALARERRVQETVLRIKTKHGKNAIIMGMNLEEGATNMERNRQIGGHRA